MKRYNNETKRCLFCGGESRAETTHFHGKVSSFCQFSTCRKEYNYLNTMINTAKNGKFNDVKAFAELVEQKVFVEKEPAIEWKRQLSICRKRHNKATVSNIYVENGNNLQLESFLFFLRIDEFVKENGYILK